MMIVMGEREFIFFFLKDGVNMIIMCFLLVEIMYFNYIGMCILV